jgi:hypothetical protein
LKEAVPHRSVTTREPKRRIAPKAVMRFKEKVRELTRRTRGVSTERMAEELARYLQGWIGYFGKCQTPSVLEGLEQWVRRRLRSAIWKQWKRGSVRFAELRKRGVGKDLAAQTAGSAHGPWRLADSPALAFALPNAYFDSLGIVRRLIFATFFGIARWTGTAIGSLSLYSNDDTPSVKIAMLNRGCFDKSARALTVVD